MFILPYLKPYRKLLVAVLILAVINQVFSLLDPQVFRRVTDNYISKIDTFKDTPELLYRGILLGLGMMVGTAMISRIAKNFQDYFANVMTQKMGMAMFSDTINHAFRLPYAALEDQSSGQLLSKLQKARTDIQNYILQLINTVFVAVVSVVFVMGYAFYTHWLVGVFLLSLFPLMGGASYLLSSKIKKAQDGIVKQSAYLSGTTTETIRNISLVKILGLETQELKRIDTANNQILDLELDKIRKVRSIEFIQGTLVNAIRVGMLGTMFWMIFKGYLTLGEFFSLFFYSFWVFAPLGQIGMVMKNYQEALASHDVLVELTKIPTTEENPNPKKLETIKNISLDSVEFGYSTESKILKGISCEMKAGQTIAFVGPSGGGKSTILKMLVGLYPPTAGSVMYNGNNLTDYSLSELSHRIGIVTQDPQLFSGSIKDNLIFVKPSASDEDCMRVIEQAQLVEFINSQPEGLNTKIGEGGLKLSGGQKQRLAIARALLRDPEVLIFDEATSSLDSMIEKEITETIKDITKSRPNTITILVAHRLSTVMHADDIYVLEKGLISESGTHHELVEKKGLYYALWREQIGEEV